MQEKSWSKFIRPLKEKQRDDQQEITINLTFLSQFTDYLFQEICDKFTESEFATSLNNKSKQPSLELDDGYKSKIDSSYKRGFWTQLKWVLWRSWVTNLREPLLTSVRIAQTVVSFLTLCSCEIKGKKVTN